MTSCEEEFNKKTKSSSVLDRSFRVVMMTWQRDSSDLILNPSKRVKLREPVLNSNWFYTSRVATTTNYIIRKSSHNNNVTYWMCLFNEKGNEDDLTINDI